MNEQGPSPLGTTSAMKARLMLVVCAAAVMLAIAAGGTWRLGPPVSPLLILNSSDRSTTLSVAGRPDIRVAACSFGRFDLPSETDWTFTSGGQTIDSQRLAGSGSPRVVTLTVVHDGGVGRGVAIPGDTNAAPSDPHPCAGE